MVNMDMECAYVNFETAKMTLRLDFKWSYALWLYQTEVIFADFLFFNTKHMRFLIDKLFIFIHVDYILLLIKV